MTMNSEVSSFELYCRKFSTEQACIDALFEARWPDGYRCPACKHPHCYVIRTRRLPLYECRSCGLQTSPIAGTIFEGSRTPLTLWFQAIFLLTQPTGISAIRLSQIIQVTYKTAWLIAHKIRHAMQHADAEQLLAGLVRIDRTHYGYSMFGDAKQPLIIGGSLDEYNQLAHVKIKQPEPSHVDNDTRWIQERGVQAFMQKHLNKQALPVFAQSGLRHPDLNQIRREMTFWLNETFHGIGPKHLQAYLDEFCFRWNWINRRRSLLHSLLNWCASTPTIIYKDLVRSKPVLPVPWVIWGSKAKWKGRHLSLWNECRSRSAK